GVRLVRSDLEPLTRPFAACVAAVALAAVRRRARVFGVGRSAAAGGATVVAHAARAGGRCAAARGADVAQLGSGAAPRAGTALARAGGVERRRRQRSARACLDSRPPGTAASHLA